MDKVMTTRVPVRRIAAYALFGLASWVGNSAVMAAAVAAPGGLYVGYYQEDPRTNPEDPMPGAFVLKLPDQDAAFGGAMFFTFVGCQTSNVGAVKGVKAGAALSGSWSGTIDGSVQTGAYSGTYDKAASAYKGVYVNAGGKQHKTIAGCIEYYIGPNGTWAMFPVEQNQPAGFQLNVTGGKVSWAAVPNTAMTLVYLVDAAAALAGTGNPIKAQTILPGQVTGFPLQGTGLVKGKEYIVVALVNTPQARRAAFASKRFVAP
jgi:hypothetical protein